jgi:D-serine deaminase-like pyridoxal phosphate-dependent protein
MAMIEKDAWYTIMNAEEIDSPALIFYPSRIEKNIERLKAMIPDVLRLRPHVKTHKTREVALMMMDAGIRKFKCATIAEAEMLGMIKAPDVLLAYQPVGPKLIRFISLIHQYPSTDFSCLVDNLQAAAAINSGAEKEKLAVTVYIDLNVGMNRTGIAPNEKAIELFRFCASLNGLKPVGLHFYDGHISDREMEKRRMACSEVLAQVEQVREQLRQEGHEPLKLVGGGSPSFPIYAQCDYIECSPGTFVFWDRSYQEQLPEQTFLTAAIVVTRIISLPDERKVCMDLGYKSIASEKEVYNRLHFLNAPNLKVLSQSEEHLVAEAPDGHSWKVGDVLYVLPVHICPTVALYEHAFIVNEGMVAGSWQIIARDRKIHC